MAPLLSRRSERVSGAFEQASTRAKNYLIAVLSVSLALAGTAVLQSFLQTRSLLFVLAVMFSAFFGGLGPGLLSSVLSVLLITYFFCLPSTHLRWHRYRMPLKSSSSESSPSP